MPSFAHVDAQNPLPAELCISSFLVSLDDKGLLVGQMRDFHAWQELDSVRSMKAFGPNLWVLPGSHLRVGEDPTSAAKRIAEEQLRASPSGLRLARVLSYASPVPGQGQDMHWDLCFVYDADLEVNEIPPWFAELRRVPLANLRPEIFARGHGDVLVDFGLLKPGK